MPLLPSSLRRRLRSSRRRLAILAAFAVVGLVGHAALDRAALFADTTVSVGMEIRGMATASDGDSLRIGDTRVRLLGIDAPELDQTCRWDGQQVPCGEMARDVLSDMMEGEPVSCLVVDIDRYGRAVAECLGVPGSLNAAMAFEGWAIAMPRFSTRFVAPAQEAQLAGAGLWAMEFHDPADWRRGARW